jgi:hypothetical protein
MIRVGTWQKSLQLALIIKKMMYIVRTSVYVRLEVNIVFQLHKFKLIASSHWQPNCEIQSTPQTIQFLVVDSDGGLLNRSICSDKNDQ